MSGSAARVWVEGWRRAWPARDADAIGALYSGGAVFQSHPFRELQSPAAYAEWAFAEQRSVELRFGDPIVDGDRAAVEWWAVITSTGGSVETIAGVSLLRFDREGRVIEQRDAWNSADGRVELPHWAR